MDLVMQILVVSEISKYCCSNLIFLICSRMTHSLTSMKAERRSLYLGEVERETHRQDESSAIRVNVLDDVGAIVNVVVVVVQAVIASLASNLHHLSFSFYILSLTLIQ